ncbi:hypothetical protein EJB05_34594, partial [Eragrostis curvula]
RPTSSNIQPASCFSLFRFPQSPPRRDATAAALCATQPRFSDEERPSLLRNRLRSLPYKSRTQHAARFFPARPCPGKTERRRHWLRCRAAWRSRRPSSPPLRPGKPIPIERRSSRELADPSTSSIRSRDAVRDAFFPVSGETSQPSPSSGTTSRTRPLLTGTSASQDHTKTAPAILDTPPSPHPAPGGHQQPTPVITVVTSSPRLPCSPEAPR